MKGSFLCAERTSLQRKLSRKKIEQCITKTFQEFAILNSDVSLITSTKSYNIFFDKLYLCKRTIVYIKNIFRNNERKLVLLKITMIC